MRVALGAKHWDVVRTVAGRTLLLVALGIAGGLAASFALSVAVRSSAVRRVAARPPHLPLSGRRLPGGVDRRRYAAHASRPSYRSRAGDARRMSGSYYGRRRPMALHSSVHPRENRKLLEIPHLLF